MSTKSKSASESTVSNGLILRGFRKQNKLTQTEIGSVVGRSSKTVGHWETGYHNIPESIISILNKKYKLGLVSTKSTKSSKSGSKSVSTRKPTRVKGSSYKSVESRVSSYIKNSGMKVSQFSNKYGLATAAVYRILNSVGEHYFSFKTLSKLAKDTDLNKLFR